MKRNIIHIIVSMIIGLAGAASCTSESGPVASDIGEELKFEAMETAASRATITNTSNLTEQPFLLFGDMNRTGEYFPGLKKIFNGQTVAFKNNKWDYGPAQYWLMGQEHSFVAVHPATSTEISDITYSESKVSFTYTIPATGNIINNKTTTDVLVATHRRMYTLNSAGEVQFKFKHILSQINIAPALDEVLMYENETDKVQYPYNKDEYINFTKIEIFGLRTTASFSFIPDPLPVGEYRTDDITGTYEVDNNSVGKFVLTYTKPKMVTNNKTNVSLLDTNDGLLVLPQRINEDAKMVLYYTVNDDNPERKITLPLSGLKIDEWGFGKIYTYMFTIEKAYTGQIKPGSLKWTVIDVTDKDAGDQWISEDDIIRQDFTVDDGELVQ